MLLPKPRRQCDRLGQGLAAVEQAQRGVTVVAHQRRCGSQRHSSSIMCLAQSVSSFCRSVPAGDSTVPMVPAA